MQSVLLWSAAAVSLTGFAVHTFMGGAVVARPLLADRNLPKASRWLSYYCWHVATVMLLFTSGAFAYSATYPGRLELAIFVSSLAIVLSLLSAAVAFKARINPLRLPSTTLLALTGLLGWGGIAAL
ncbi:MAG: hypothetical protein ACFCUR_16945 [Rhodomicrobiaceae bacterium]